MYKENLLSFENVSAKKLSTYRGGGIVKYVVYPTTVSMIKKVVNFAYCEGLPFFILGNGSNTLISDVGYKGIFICTKLLDKVSIYKNIAYCGSGVKIKTLFNYALQHELGGISKLASIPATIGGMIVSNAGCFNSEISDVLLDVDVLDLHSLAVKRLKKEDIQFGYRTCNLKDKYFIIGARFNLEFSSKQQIINEFNYAVQIRRETQPNLPSLGSVYKRDEFIPAKLIDSLGLKGFSVGGAMVSTKHSNFIVNTGVGTATDYIRVMDKVESLVYSEFKVNLTREINIL